MPSASELEEFGLEVEEEHQRLVDAPDPGVPAQRNGRVHPLSLSLPSKEQRSLLQSANARVARLGALKLAGLLVLALAVAALVHLGRERDEAARVEAHLPGEDVDEGEVFKKRSEAGERERAGSQASNDATHGALADGGGERQDAGAVGTEAADAPATAGDDGLGSFGLARLRDTRAAARDLAAALERYYGGAPRATRMMFGAWARPWDFDGPRRRGQNAKLIDTVARALVAEDRAAFVIGGLGSSVMAGHDNCHYDSYGSQLERTLGPVWAAAGMDLVFQNAGEGGGCGDDFRNQVYCVAQNVAPDVDVVHYSWTYFEEGGRDDALAARESLVRWAQRLPRRPPVHVLNVLSQPGGQGMEDEAALADHYAAYGYNTFWMRSGHALGGHDYKTEKENGVDRYAWGFQGDGYHNITRYGANEENPARRESLSVVMRNWHPGPLAFEFVSDTFAYLYAQAMLAALDLIEAQLTAARDPRRTWSSTPGDDDPATDALPRTKHCDPAYCAGDAVPGCLNYERPTFGSPGAAVVAAEDAGNPHGGAAQNWQAWYEGHDMWHMVGKQDTAIFSRRDDKDICRHLDRCGGMSADAADAGTVVFRLPAMKVGLVAICGCCGKDVGTNMFLQNEHLRVEYGGTVLDRTTWDLFPTAKCVRLLAKFPTEEAAAEAAAGRAYLSLTVVEGLREPVRISHVITL